MLVQVPDDFFCEFNLFGLAKQVANYDEAMDLINDDEDADSDYELQAQKLYSLVH